MITKHLLFRKLIIFIVSIGLLLICLGSVLIALYSLYQEDYKHIRPFLVIGKLLSLIPSMCIHGTNTLYSHFQVQY